MSIKTAGIHQPNYMPWPGYFYKLAKSDVFVILDNVDFQQGNSNSITSRTRIKGGNGEIMLTVPVRKSDDKLLNRIAIDKAQPWKKKHLKSIQLAYAKAPYFKTVYPVFEELLTRPYDNLALMNTAIISGIACQLDIHTPVVIASELKLDAEDRNERIVQICEQVGAGAYLCGKGGRKYMEEAVFVRGGIEVKYTDFKPVEYAQLYGAFISGLSILDPLMNIGKTGVLQMIEHG
jgi:hypothetical protein